jgi:hypothetical protein
VLPGPDAGPSTAMEPACWVLGLVPGSGPGILVAARFKLDFGLHTTGRGIQVPAPDRTRKTGRNGQSQMRIGEVSSTAIVSSQPSDSSPGTVGLHRVPVQSDALAAR